MIVVNFTHPIEKRQIQQLKTMIGQSELNIMDVPCQLDNTWSFAVQVAERMDEAGLSPTGWQTGTILVNLSACAQATSILIAEPQNRISCFLSIICIRPVAGSNPPQFEVAEVINLQAVREKTRSHLINT